MNDYYIFGAIAGGIIFFKLIEKIIWDWLKLSKNNGQGKNDLLISSLTNLNNSLIALNETLKELHQAVAVMSDIVSAKDIDGHHRIYGDPEVRRIAERILDELKKQ